MMSGNWQESISIPKGTKSSPFLHSQISTSFKGSMSRGVQPEMFDIFEQIILEHGDLGECLQAMVIQDLSNAEQNPSSNTSEDADLGFDRAHLDTATILSIIEALCLYVDPQANPGRIPASEQSNRSGSISRNDSLDLELDAAIALSLEEVEDADEPLDDSLIPTTDDEEAAPAEPISVAVTSQDDIDSDEQLQSQEEDVGNESQGLSKELLDSFPVQELKAKSGWFSSNKSDPEGCPICVTEYEVRSMLLTLPCLHMYHEPCIKEWLKENKTCPICKIDMSAPQA